MDNITTQELAALLESNGGDLHGKRLRRSLECSDNQARAILHWMDGEGLTIKEPRRRYINPGLGLADVVEILREEYSGVTFERKRVRGPRGVYRPYKKQRPWIRCVFDINRIFEGTRITLYQLYHSADGVPFGYGTIWRYEGRDGERCFLCYAHGQRLFRVTGGYEPIQLAVVRVPSVDGPGGMELVDV